MAMLETIEIKSYFVVIKLFFVLGGWPLLYEQGKPPNSQLESTRRSIHHNLNLRSDQHKEL